MKKAIPVIIAVVLIIIVGAVAFGSVLIGKYSYSTEKADMNEYFKILEEGQVPIILQDEKTDLNARLIDGTYYVDFETLHTYFNARFYYDSKENLLLYTTPTDIIKTQPGTTTYSVGDVSYEESYILSMTLEDVLYVAMEYAIKYSGFTYTTYTEPVDYMQVYTEWGEQTVATVTKDMALRYQGGVKSEILEQLTEGEEVVILEVMDTWTKVKSPRSMIGYIENKYLSESSTRISESDSKYVEPVYSNISLDETICLGFHAIGGPSGNSTISEVLQNASSVNVLSPTWFHLTDDEGNFDSFASQSYVDYAHDRGIQVWALISNIENNSSLNTNEMLSYTSKRKQFIDNIIAEVLAYDIDGINIDFEYVTSEYGEDFIEFIRELSIPCRANGIILSIDNYVPMSYNMFYNRKEQGIVADYVIIMGYDEHIKGGGEAGSVASIDYVENGIVQTIEEVLAKKVINAVPFYTVRWETKDGEVTGGNIGMEEAEGFLDRNGITVAWDDETCQNYGEAQIGDTFYQIWLEDEQSLAVKMNVMKMNNVAGIAAWRLGFEKASIWDAISDYVNAE